MRPIQLSTGLLASEAVAAEKERNAGRKNDLVEAIFESGTNWFAQESCALIV